MTQPWALVVVALITALTTIGGQRVAQRASNRTAERATQVEHVGLAVSGFSALTERQLEEITRLTEERDELRDLERACTAEKQELRGQVISLTNEVAHLNRELGRRKGNR